MVPNILRRAPIGKASLRTTVLASGKVIDVIGASGLRALEKKLPPGWRAMKRSQLHFTSPLLITRPLVGALGSSLLFWRRWTVNWRTSGEYSQAEAASPSGSPVAG